jgi:hypothetical protein
VGVTAEEKLVPLPVLGCDFSWTSGFKGAITIRAAILQQDGSGDVTILPVQELSPTLTALLLQSGGSFPVTIQPSAQTVISGANVTFAISPTNSSSPLNYQWRINGVSISGATNLTLQLLNVTTSNTGNYDAVLSNSNGSIASAVATLTVLNVPIIQTPVTMTNGQVVLTWTAPLGKTCQLQYKTNLNQTNWINIGSALTASNMIMSFTNAIGSDKQCFYRVQQQ